MKVNAYLEVIVRSEGAVLECRCGHVLGPANVNYKLLSLEARYPIQAAGPYSNPHRVGRHQFELREYYCPKCLVRYEAEIALAGDCVMHDVELVLASKEGTDGIHQA